LKNNPQRDYSTLSVLLEPENNPCAGDNVVTGSGDKARLAGYVISDFQTQDKVALQDDVRPASVIPGELVTVVRAD
jgi:hypothetical protein